MNSLIPKKNNINPIPHRNLKSLTFILFGIVLLTLIIYSNSLNNDFLTNWDDKRYVVENNDIKGLSWQNIKNIFSNFYMGNYQPLSVLSYALEYKFFGLNPAAYHTTNLFFHLLNTILVFYFIYLLSYSTISASIVALLFAIHPMHVESVAWIAERKDLMYACFYLGSLICYLYYLKKGYQFKYLFICFLLFVFSIAP